MTLNLQTAFVRALSVLALSAFLPASVPAQTKTAPKRPAAQKKTEAQKKSAGQQKPGPSTPKGTQETVQQQTRQAQDVTRSILIRWEGKPGVNRYRLQVARDRDFQDIVFDQAVEGRQYVVK